MKVEIVKTIKISSGKIVPAGAVFSDPLPEWLSREVNTGSSAVRVIDSGRSATPLSIVVEPPSIESELPKPTVKKRERKRLAK